MRLCSSIISQLDVTLFKFPFFYSERMPRAQQWRSTSTSNQSGFERGGAAAVGSYLFSKNLLCAAFACGSGPADFSPFSIFINISPNSRRATLKNRKTMFYRVQLHVAAAGTTEEEPQWYNTFFISFTTFTGVFLTFHPYFFTSLASRWTHLFK